VRHGKRWLVARLPALPLDRVEQSRLLAADVGSRAATELDVERDAGAHYIGAQESCRPSVFDGIPEAIVRERVLAADVEESSLRSGGEAGDRERLDHRERVALHDDAVFERAGLRFVRVADHVARRHRLLGDGLPLDARRKRGASPAEKLGVGDGLDDGLRPPIDGYSEGLVSPVGSVVLKQVRIDDANSSQKAKPMLRWVFGLGSWGRPVPGTRHPDHSPAESGIFLIVSNH